MASAALPGSESKSSTKTRTAVSGMTSVTARVRGETWLERGANGVGHHLRRAQIRLADAGNQRSLRQRLEGIDGRLPRPRHRGGQHPFRRKLHRHRRTRARLRTEFGLAENRIHRSRPQLQFAFSP